VAGAARGRRVKPAPFDYRAPTSLEEALPLLGLETTVLAGGQSLVPLLNLRLARPELVVDVNGIAELDYIRADDGPLRIGALTRQLTLERSELARRGWPLLAKAVAFVGHPQIRTRGTVGGSVAHADPAAELPAALVALDALIHLRSATDARVVPAAEFFRGPLYTAREPDELLVEIEVPAQTEGAGSGFAEHARTHGDFATAGAAAVVVPGGHAAIALLGAGPVPVRAVAAERALAGGADAGEAAALVAQAVDGEHRAALCAELVRRAVEEAMA
jgi:CO/xanthine dehydrogenase FAD-binding subunit